MKIIKPISKQQRQKLANNAAKRWRGTYYEKDNKWYQFQDSRKTSEQTWLALLSLGKNPDPDKIDSIIDNPSWTHHTYRSCASCSNPIENGVEIGITNQSYNLCIVCIEEAYKLCH